MFFKTRSLKKIGSFDPNLKGSEDHDLWFRISISNLRVNYVNMVLVKTEKFNFLQISINYNLRKQSLNYFSLKFGVNKSLRLNHFIYYSENKNQSICGGKVINVSA